MPIATPEEIIEAVADERRIILPPLRADASFDWLFVIRCIQLVRSYYPRQYNARGKGRKRIRPIEDTYPMSIGQRLQLSTAGEAEDLENLCHSRFCTLVETQNRGLIKILIDGQTEPISQPAEYWKPL